MAKDLSDKCWKTQSKRWHLLTNNPGQESESEEEEDSVMAALMRSTDEEIKTNCKLVRDDIESQRVKRNSSKV